MAPRRSRSTAPNVETIRIVLVEPRALLGLGIRGALDREPDMEVVAEVRSADDAMAVAEDRAPDVFILDVELQEPSTSAATHRLAQEAPTSGIVVVGREDDDASILEAVEIGAMGHVPAVADPGELVAVIRKVAEGEDPLRDEVIGRPDLIDKVMETFREGFRRSRGATRQPAQPTRAGGPAPRGRGESQPRGRRAPGYQRADRQEPPVERHAQVRRAQPAPRGDVRGPRGLARPRRGHDRRSFAATGRRDAGTSGRTRRTARPDPPAAAPPRPGRLDREGLDGGH